MRAHILLAILFAVSSWQSSFCQTLFVNGGNTLDDDAAVHATEIQGGKLFFVGETYGSSAAEGNGLAFITDSSGNILHQLTLPGVSDSLFIILRYGWQKADGSLAALGNLHSRDFQTMQFKKYIIMLQFDTLLNVQQWHQYLIPPDEGEIKRISATVLGNKVYGLAMMYQCSPCPSNAVPAGMLFKISDDGSGFSSKILDSTTLSAPFPVKGAYTTDIVPGDDTSHFYIGISWMGSSIAKVSKDFNVLDTVFNYDYNTPNPFSTPIPRYAPSIVRYAPGKLIWFSSFARIFPQLSQLAPGRIDFNNHASTKFSALPKRDSLDGSVSTWLPDVRAVSLSLDHRSFYVFGMESNALLTVGKYDTSGLRLWSRFVGIDSMVQYYPHSIFTLRDSSVICLASRLRYNHQDGWDHYIFKLTKDGFPTSIVNLSQQLKGDITVFPNPATERLTIRLPKSAACTVQLLNATGREVLAQAFQGTEVSLPVQDFAPGIYTYRVSVDGGKSFSGLWLKK